MHECNVYSPCSPSCPLTASTPATPLTLPNWGPSNFHPPLSPGNSQLCWCTLPVMTSFLDLVDISAYWPNLLIHRQISLLSIKHLQRRLWNGFRTQRVCRDVALFGFSLMPPCHLPKLKCMSEEAGFVLKELWRKTFLRYFKVLDKVIFTWKPVLRSGS